MKGHVRGTVMPIHDWTKVDAGIFHDFHHAWIEQIKRLLNGGVLPPDHYALAEQHTSHFGPDVLTLQSRIRRDEDEHQDNGDPIGQGSGPTSGGVILARPKARLAGEPTWSSIVASKTSSRYVM